MNCKSTQEERNTESEANIQRPWQHQADFLLLLFEIGSCKRSKKKEEVRIK